MRAPRYSLALARTMARHQYTIQKVLSKREGGGTASLGTRKDVYALFARMNTAPQSANDSVLYGPGIRVELLLNGDQVEAIDLRVTEDDLFILLFEGTEAECPGKLARIVKNNGWRLFNLESGQCYPSIATDDDDDDEVDF